MTFSGMDPQQIRSLAAQISHRASELRAVLRQVDAQVHQAAGVWDGQDMARFRTQWQSEHRPTLSRAAEQLHDVEQVLRANADSQEQGSAAAMGGSSAAGAPHTNALETMQRLVASGQLPAEFADRLVGLVADGAGRLDAVTGAFMEGAGPGLFPGAASTLFQDLVTSPPAWLVSHLTVGEWSTMQTGADALKAFGAVTAGVSIGNEFIGVAGAAARGDEIGAFAGVARGTGDILGLVEGPGKAPATLGAITLDMGALIAEESAKVDPAFFEETLAFANANRGVVVEEVGKAAFQVAGAVWGRIL